MPTIPWPHWRTLLITLVLASHLLVALPIKKPITPETLDDPQHQQEVDRWMRLFGPLGLTRPTLVQGLIQITRVLWDADRALVEPMTRLWRHLELGQAWSLFAIPTEQPRTLEIYVEDRAGRHLHHRTGEVEDPELAPWLGYRRIRGIYDTRHRTSSYRKLSEHVSRKLMTERPDLTAVVLQQQQRSVGTPGEVFPDTTQTLLVHRTPRHRLWPEEGKR